MNGRRLAPSAQGFITDLSLIPIAAISRVEILKDGASAMYGADAIAGVVNFILKEKSDASETRMGYGFTTPAGRQEVSASQEFGAIMDRGSFVVVASYVDQTRLSTDERPWTRNVAALETIYPSNEQVSVHFAGRYELTDSEELRGTLLHDRTDRFAQGALPSGHLAFPISMNRTHASLSAHHEGTHGWKIAVTGYLNREDADFSFLSFAPGSLAWDVEHSEVQQLTQEQWTLGATASKAIGVLPAGDLALALGTEHREETYVRELRSPIQRSEDVARTVNSAYVEVLVPLVGQANRMVGAEALSLSFASRYDMYSDVGDILNPKFAVSWTVSEGFEVRSTLGWSFRAPTVGEELSSTSRGTEARVGIYSFKSPDGQDTIPLALLSGSTHLSPERARHWTAGFVVRPTTMPGWKFEVTYYDITYTDRIVGPPLDPDALSNPDLRSFIKQYSTPAELQAALASETGGRLEYVDRTGEGYRGGAFGPDPQNSATYALDGRLTNASVLRTSGVDVGVDYVGEVRMGRLHVALTGTLVNEFETVFAPGARAVDSVGTTGQPAGLRVVATGELTHDGWGAALALNFTDGYSDTSTSVHGRVQPFTTVDARLSYTFRNRRTSALKDVSIRFSVANILNEAPPYIAGSIANRFANYDVANAEPLGRLVSLEVGKRW